MPWPAPLQQRRPTVCRAEPPAPGPAPEEQPKAPHQPDHCELSAAAGADAARRARAKQWELARWLERVGLVGLEGSDYDWQVDLLERCLSAPQVPDRDG